MRSSAVAVVHGQRRLLPEQQVEDLLRFPGVLGAFVDAEVVGGGNEQFLDGVQSHHLAFQLGWWFEERLPAFFQPAARHLRRIVAVAGGAPEIGNAVVVAGIEAKGPEVFLQIAQARQLALVELLQQPLLDEYFYETVRRHHHVVGAATGLELGQQRLVAVVGVEGGLDPGVLLELLQ